MSEVRSVTVQIYAPSGNDHGQVTYGYYTVDDGMLTMTDEDGAPIVADGQMFQEAVPDARMADQVAGRLTRLVRRALRGDTEAQERFRRPMTLGKAGFA